MPIKIFLIALIAQIMLSGCAWLGQNTSYRNDPLTGGVNAGASSLLHVALPAGMQAYPSHGYSEIREGGREGLETLRGNVDASSAAMTMFNNLKSAGWQLRMSARKSPRAIYLYQKQNEFAILSFHPQGLLTILEIWTGPRLADGANLLIPSLSPAEELPSIEGEEFGPIEETRQAPAPKGSIETWGKSSSIEEMEI